MTEGNGEKSDESSEKYVIEKPEGDEKDEDDGNRDDKSSTPCVDKKISLCSGQHLPPGWEKHEGESVSKVIVVSFFMPMLFSFLTTKYSR